MRRIIILFFITVAFTSYSQNPLQSISKTYFRTDPFDTKFSSFITSIQKDPWFTIKEFHRRTDSTFFFLSGSYKHFNPFRFIPKEIRLVIAEDELVYDDSLHTIDTIINLQLMAIADSASVNGKSVEKEFRRFYKNQSDRFSSYTYKNYEKNGVILAETYNYFLSPLSIAPLSIVWGRLPETYDYTFTIVIRFKIKENTATYILTPDEQL